MSPKLFLFTTVLVSSLALAQPETATLRGAVVGTGGDPIRATNVLITEVDTGLSRQVVTGEDGGYEAPFLKPGLYRVNIDRQGFQSFTANGIELKPGETRRFDPVLIPGTLAETQETAATPTVLADGAAVTGLIGGRATWSDAPVVDRRGSPLPLLVTAPAVQGNGRGLIIAGESSRIRQTWAVDGVPHDTVAQAPNPNYFEAVNIVASNPSVEAYRPTGFDMVSRRGLDTWHGSAYYRHGSSDFDARSYFDASKVSYRMREVGGEAGGALIRGWTYVYGGWTYQKDKRSETIYADVPTTKMRAGDFSQLTSVIRDPRIGTPFPNNQIPASRRSAVPANLLTNYYPSPTDGDTNLLTANYSRVHPYGRDPYTQQWPFARIDQKLADSNQAYFRFLQLGATSILPGSVSELLDSTQRSRLRSWVFSDTQTFSPTLVNHAKLARISTLVRQGQEENDFTPLLGGNVVTTVGLQGVNANGLVSAGFPTVSIAGLNGLSMQAAGGAEGDSIAHRDGVWSFDDTIAWSKGRHAIHLGGQVLRMRWQDGTVPQNTYGAFSFSGAFSGNGFADFLLGLPATSTRANPKVNRPLRQDQGGVFLTDSFRITRRLTIDLGLRWDYFGSPTYDDGFMSSWNPATGAVIVAPGTLTTVSPLYPNANKVTVGQVVPKANLANFRPRVAVAYRLNDRMAIRAGYGEFTAAAAYGAGGLLSATNPYWLTETYTNSITNGTAALNFPKPFPTTPAASQTPGQSVTALPDRANEGVIRQYNLSIERTVLGATFRASYLGSRGSGMNYTPDINKPEASAIAFTNARKPYPQFVNTYVTRTDGSWRYDAAQFEVRKSAGPVTFDLNFTWGSNRANYLNTLDPYHVTNTWTRDAADRRLYFTTSASYAIPAFKTNRILSNWTVNAIVTAATGQYYTPVYTGADSANASAGFVTQPADCLANGLFAAPPSTAGRYGSCGMNSQEGYPIHIGHVSLVKQIPLKERLRAVFTAQISNVTNTPHFTVPNANISTPGAGTYTATSSAVDNYSPERLGYRQIHLKIRLEF